MNTPSRPVRLPEHIYHKSGEAKTVCVTACLTALGVPVNAYHYTGYNTDCNRREAILRRHGYAVRSRLSALGKKKTVGNARKVIQRLNDPAGTFYLVIVTANKKGHALLLNDKGETVVDTAPRKMDKRRIVSIKACFKTN